MSGEKVTCDDMTLYMPSEMKPGVPFNLFLKVTLTLSEGGIKTMGNIVDSHEPKCSLSLWMEEPETPRGIVERFKYALGLR